MPSVVRRNPGRQEERLCCDRSPGALFVVNSSSLISCLGLLCLCSHFSSRTYTNTQKKKKKKKHTHTHTQLPLLEVVEEDSRLVALRLRFAADPALHLLVRLLLLPVVCNSCLRSHLQPEHPLTRSLFAVRMLISNTLTGGFGGFSARGGMLCLFLSILQLSSYHMPI
jgi:hypothetical protein